MALSDYTVWLCDSRGYRQRLVSDAIRLSYVLNDTDPGQFVLVLPGYYSRLIQMPDAIVEIWRAPLGKTHTCEGVFMTHWKERQYSQGEYLLAIGGPDLKGLLETRIIAYKSNGAYTQKSGYPGNIMREFVRENLGPDAVERSDETTADPSREIDTYGFSVEANRTEGTSIDFEACRENLYDVLRKIREAAAYSNETVLFDMVPTGFNPITFQFRAYFKQRGTDRTRATGGSPLIFSPESGSLADASVRYDYGDEANVAFVAGYGTGRARIVVEVEDTARTSTSPWRRREILVDAPRAAPGTNEIYPPGWAALAGRRPSRRLTGQAVSQPGTLYGVDWFVGDRVTVSFDGEEFEARIQSVSVSVDAGSDSVSARFEVST